MHAPDCAFHENCLACDCGAVPQDTPTPESPSIPVTDLLRICDEARDLFRSRASLDRDPSAHEVILYLEVRIRRFHRPSRETFEQTVERVMRER